jgi:hypothetical protein
VPVPPLPRLPSTPLLRICAATDSGFVPTPGSDFTPGLRSVLLLNLLDIPFRFVLGQTFPVLCALEEVSGVHVHPHSTLGLLSVSVTTIVLFFASGMYSERITYTNRSVSFLFLLGYLLRRRI